MTVEDLQSIPSRHLRKPSASARRLAREQMDMSAVLDHELTQTLPLVASETMGVGYGFDRLVAVHLTGPNRGKRLILPSRYELTKATAATSNAANRKEVFYRGIKADRHWTADSSTGVGHYGIERLFNTSNTTDWHETIRIAKGRTGNNDDPRLAEGWAENKSEAYAQAFVSNGKFSQKPLDNNEAVRVGYYQYDDGGLLDLASDITLDFDTIETLLEEGGSITDSAKNNAAYDMLYRMLPTTAWEFIEVNADVIADLPKVMKDLDNYFFNLYNKERSHFGNRIRDPHTLRLALSLTELGHTLRRARFSPNVATAAGVKGLKNWKFTLDGSTQEITGGVVNDLFAVFGTEAEQAQVVVAPWWLIDKLDQYNYVDDERELEQRDIERKDVIEALSLVFQAADYERGLAHGGESTLPMLLFEKYKEGILKDFTDFKSSEVALAASMFGYPTARDAFYGRQSTNMGRVPYYSDLPNAHGKLLGSEFAEFKDRIKEQSEHSIAVVSTDNFKQGMAIASSFDYQVMVGRTRFGDHHMDVRVYAGCHYRIAMNSFTMRNNHHGGENVLDDDGNSVWGSFLGADKMQTEVPTIMWFPLHSWSMYETNTSTEGFLPVGLNGAAYQTDPGIYDTFVDNSTDHQKLWPSANGRHIWEPGVDQYFARMMSGLNDCYRQWVDRADELRTENVTAPTFGAINLVAEMSMDTPSAMVQRNFPFLRRISTVPSVNVGSIDAADTSFDFMTNGDNFHGMSVWQGKTMFALEDRQLFDEHVHDRDGKLDLAPGVLPLTKAPENWPAVLQTRDWLGFHTSFYSEPIMDAYTASMWSTAPGSRRSNGHGTSRLVTYQVKMLFDGTVRDVACTAIRGAGKTVEGDDVSTFNYKTNSELISCYPTTLVDGHNYEMMLLSPSRIRGGTARCMRSDAGVAANTLPDLGDYTGNDALTEDDFVPGRAFAKLWLPEVSISGRKLDWAEMFTDVEATLNNKGSSSPTAADYGNMAYLHPVTSSIHNTCLDMDSISPAGNGNLGKRCLGGDIAASGDPVGLIGWLHTQGRFIELMREQLEYQHASPVFYVFDKDMNDETEARMRYSRVIFNESTIGPITFIGGITAEGSAALSETITGDSVFEIINLSSGTASSANDAADPDADDEAAGEDNPSLHIADKQEVE